MNAFEIRGVGDSIRGLYPLTAMMNSSCSPNTQNSIDSDWMCRVRAVRAINKGEEITDTYTYTMSNTLSRRKHLKSAKYFDCSCARCSDPTEFGSHYSTLLCRSNGCGGFVVCRQPLLSSSAWVCLKCGGEVQGEEVRREQEEWEEKVEAAPREIKVQEELLQSLRQVYHPSHNLCTDIMFNLLPMYGARGGKEELVEEAEKKEKVCEELLTTMGRVIPGGFRMRGMMLVEQHTTKSFLLRCRLEAKESSKSQFVRRLASLRAPLVEAIAILGYEPEGSLEHARVLLAHKYLKQLDSVVNSCDKEQQSS